MLKRYALFTHESYYPSGGWDDFEDTFDTVEEAKAAVEGERQEGWSTEPGWYRANHFQSTSDSAMIVDGRPWWAAPPPEETVPPPGPGEHFWHPGQPAVWWSGPDHAQVVDLEEGKIVASAYEGAWEDYDT